MIERVLEVEAMDDAAEAEDYDAMDHTAVNAGFVDDFLAATPSLERVLDVGTGTARIPLELVRRAPTASVTAIDLSEAMLAVARRNVEAAGALGRVTLVRGDSKGIYLPDGACSSVISNSIVHHIPEPARALAEMIRVLASGGVLFVRDLFRPHDRGELDRLVAVHAARDTERQRKLFADSLGAALTTVEVRAAVLPLGVPASAVSATSDRHWTLSWRKRLRRFPGRRSIASRARR